MIHKMALTPRGIKLLTDEESERLTKLYPGIPTSPKNCVTCGGTKRIHWWNDAWKEVVEYECNCITQWVMHRYFLYNGIGLKYQRLAWNDLIPSADLNKAVMGAALRYRQEISSMMNTGMGLYLHGPKGTGKTSIGVLILKYALAQGFQGHFTTFNDLLNGYMDSWNDKDLKEWFGRKVKNTGLLVIDDPGRENRDSKGSIGRSTSILDDVIRHRMASDAPTIITSNESPEEFAEVYGPNVESLLGEKMDVYRMDGADFRTASNRRTKEESQQKLSRPIVVS